MTIDILFYKFIFQGLLKRSNPKEKGVLDVCAFTVFDPTGRAAQKS